MKTTSQKMPFNGGVTPCPDSPTPATAHGTAGIREPLKTRCHHWTATKSVWTSSKGSMSLQALHLASTQHPPPPPRSPCTATALRHCFTADLIFPGCEAPLDMARLCQQSLATAGTQRPPWLSVLSPCSPRDASKELRFLRFSCQRCLRSPRAAHPLTDFFCFWHVPQQDHGTERRHILLS